MTLDADACYRALETHDTRFDGRFFVGVRSTRIYCRPVCTVRLPRRENCRFYRSASAAEREGYRPCLRCRPELAPGFAAVDASARLAKAAIGFIDDGFLETRSLEALAARLGVTSRHLRRVFEAELGVTPVEYAQTQRLLLAKRLLTDTALPVTEVAYASGFGSVRRLNALFSARYRMPPGRLRQSRGVEQRDALTFMLGYRPPYAWDAMLAFLDTRAIAGVERRSGRRFVRALSIAHRGDRCTGWIEIAHAAHRSSLQVRVAPSLSHVVPQVLARIRHVFDVGCDPAAVATALTSMALACPGLRVPGAFDGFEIGVRAVVGQQISVAAMTTLLGRIAARFGAPLPDVPAGLSRTFPDATRFADVSIDELGVIGLTRAKARTILALARAVNEGLDLSPQANVEETLGRLRAIPGIGPWTAQYIAMRALGWPDAFPSTDLGVMRALREESEKRVLAIAERWRPWRAYSVIYLWSGYREKT
ncbi:MAG TPA: AlkA N-terminal domain-containing protein [Casimicrobiaceae bacterium]|nr:AlkA N-terminal domain-containing protein [Casimicrobiaceae bacterium]